MKRYGTCDAAAAPARTVCTLMMSQEALQAEWRGSCDYLIIGAGAMGLAFADELRHAKCSVILVDRRSAPGGHWNDACAKLSLAHPC